MPDSFSELRHAGGSNKPWVAGGVFALALALIGVALAAAYWSSNPHSNSLPATVTVTAQPSAPGPDLAPAGTYSGTFVRLAETTDGANTLSWPVVATFGGGTATVTYPNSGCSALIDATLHHHPLTDKCEAANGADARWEVAVPDNGLVELTYLEDDQRIAGGTLSIGSDRA
ncbi:hypothetical protein CKJ81_06355 [Corynebacterium hadale]|uniref:DUF306 domain-containing protein n=2 Tax=Corynebacterium TaxID=1716 RepID=A0AB36RM75_9CORY|nr:MULTISPECIES: hypothetical protein [Corynebacterium]MBL7285555.1 hypothetical protein [Corynebacterium godavarianum]PAT05837.1 hypothetical protein CKJ81_06355 [Corynebacterium hadale]PAT10749.1 hypothetical protein CKJ80_05080 [Corynebacterium hadale]TSJ75584.1 hypothetical protein FPH17_04140 [Corynebacterium godavarianum]